MNQIEWERSNHIQMFVQSAELRNISVHLEPSIELHCDLSNIARGACVITIKPSDIMPKGKLGSLSIPMDRPLMRAEIMIERRRFDDIVSYCRFEHPRPIAIILQIVESLAISSHGDLRVDENLDLTVQDISWNVPLI